MMNHDSQGWRRWIKPAREALENPPLCDLHMHTTWTDGRCSVHDYVTKAKLIGLQAIAITEHVGFESEWFPRFADEVEQQREHSNGVDVYRGIEVTAWDYDGKLKTSERLIQQADIVIGVVHRYPSAGGGPREFRDIVSSEALKCELRALASLAQNPNIHVLGHPGGTFYKKYGPFDVKELIPVFRLAKARGVAVELSARYTWDWSAILNILWDVNPLLSIGSDAHEVHELGRTHREVRQPLQSFMAMRTQDHNPPINQRETR